MKDQIKGYLGLKYQIKLTPLSEEDGGGWLAEIPDLKGCLSDGDTIEEALRNIEEAKEAWFVTAIKRGQQIPLPTSYQEEQYSGKFTLRLPKSLHKELAEAASEEGVSLNSYILSLLSLNFGRIRPQRNNQYSLYISYQFNESPKRQYEDDLFGGLVNLNRRLWQRENLVDSCRR